MTEIFANGIVKENSSLVNHEPPVIRTGVVSFSDPTAINTSFKAQPSSGSTFIDTSVPATTEAKFVKLCVTFPPQSPLGTIDISCGKSLAFTSFTTWVYSNNVKTSPELVFPIIRGASTATGSSNAPM